MKVAIFLVCFAALTFANIVFEHVTLTCSSSKPRVYHGCLRGQSCDFERCVNAEPFSISSFITTRNDTLLVRDVFSTDGTCGAAHGGTICDLNSKVYTGACCSQYGWCGNTMNHCGSGCQSGCTTTQVGTAPRNDGQCGVAFGGATCDPSGSFGGCCSQYGYCGNTDGHCLKSNGCQNGCGAYPPGTVIIPPRNDGRCGVDFGWARCSGTGGGCCSSHGWCGSTTDYCLIGLGCQLGCTTPSTISPPGEPGGAMTKDGTCGAKNGGTICGSWPAGNCCSMYGFCGNTDGHCGAGCQSGNCFTTPVIEAPGPSPAPLSPNPGYFTIVGQAGVPAMHAGLMPNGRVFLLDKIEDYTQLKLQNGQYAYSSEYDPVTNTVVPLSYYTNAFCSGGCFLADGRVINVGGNAPLPSFDPTIGDGFEAIRYLTRSSTDASFNGQGWSEPGNKLSSPRWYASAQILPDGSIFVVSGSLNGLDPTVLSNNNPTYEILNPQGISSGKSITMDLLIKNQPYYMYPFVHLLNDGTLFIFVSKSSEQFSLSFNAATRTYPDLPGDYRTYPNTGGSVMLPLNSANGWAGDIVICGGGAYQDISSPTEPSCGRLSPFSVNPTWEMDSMPEGRGMVEGVLLPDGTVLWLNGGSQGAQGFGLMTNPALEALLYTPNKPLGQRFQTLASSNIARLYHSVALLLLDGTLMVAGSNPVQMPILVPDAANPYVTEFRVEIFVPPYLQGQNAARRPTNVVISSKNLNPHGSTFTISFTAQPGGNTVSVTLYHGGFVTHSLHMGHRMIQLDTSGFVPGGTVQQVTAVMPPNRNVCPPGPYVLYVLVDGIPGLGQFVMVS